MDELTANVEICEAIERSASPSTVRVSLQRLIDAHPDLRGRLDDPELRDPIITVCAASRSLVRLLETSPDALRVLGDLDTRPYLDITGPGPDIEVDIDRVVRFKQLEFLRIATRDLTGIDQLADTGLALAQLATEVLAAGCALAGADRLAVIGMGKLGGGELNYSSDVDVMFVGEGPHEKIIGQARAVVDVARRCFRIDVNLRPEGRDGTLVRSVDAFEAYWDSWAQPWEFQALIKAIPVAGEPDIAGRWFAAAQTRLWNHPFTADDLRSIRSLKARAEAEIARKGLSGREIKTGPGGIRDIEFTLQLLQLVHGHADPGLRSPSTLKTLAEMADAGYVEREDAEVMGDAYDMFRRVEHRLQLVDEQQVHTLPADRSAISHLARVLGYRDSVEGDAGTQLNNELRHRQAAVRSIHQRIYFRPLLEAFAQAEGAISPEAAKDRLAAFGFLDAARTQAAVEELTKGLNRTSRMMQQLLPLLLDWLSHSPDPDMGLLVLRNLVAGDRQQSQILEAFRESPEVARRLCTLAGTSRMLADIIARNPDLVARLPDEARLLTKPRAELVTSALEATAWRSDESERHDALRRWKDRHLLGIAARDIFGLSGVDRVGRDLTALAEATLDAALQPMEPTVPVAVIGLGRFGGGELSYGSDLDLIFVHGGETAADAEEANRIVSRLIKFIAGTTPADRIFEIDTDLRPEGKAGVLVRSLEGFRSYWEDSAQSWERLAMVRARTVAGDAELGTRLLTMLDGRVWADGLDADTLRDLRKVKARVERERIPAGEDPQFHLKLGRGSLSDVEFTAQTLQLQHSLRATGTIHALKELMVMGAIGIEDVGMLTDSYRFCELVRNRLFLVTSKPIDALPTKSDQLSWLARSLDTTPTELRDRYRKVTRRARRVVERVFYGQP